ncbi:hypothetical protein DICPUDRAFT_93334 [Dictyostelium purpureum]|uniref:Uncharacterized protein n=1 Tax=Dictyostelium purpureum TaxID=5786 RepID=F1A5X5_DICPU|nr:uncharacterized protein DICPUDRAFT_93334 [Dictyostelium purpureum]EGC28405.1 hypothetical protein DICPUDRAFT_93334 [Dictyostelium purpureum]|eukprot:XP_003295069.1 hypothetical protein DICPUDRAFT_93334 [Dictyostelium purpureum]
MSMIFKRFYTACTAAEAKAILSSFPKSDMDAKIKNLLKNNADIAKKYNLTYTPLTEEQEVQQIIKYSEQMEKAREHAFEEYGQRFKDVQPLPEKTVQDFVKGL